MQWPECDEKDGDTTHSLMAIVTGAYQKWVLKGEPSVLLPMLQVLFCTQRLSSTQALALEQCIVI